MCVVFLTHPVYTLVYYTDWRKIKQILSLGFPENFNFLIQIKWEVLLNPLDRTRKTPNTVSLLSIESTILCKNATTAVTVDFPGLNTVCVTLSLINNCLFQGILTTFSKLSFQKLKKEMATLRLVYDKVFWVTLLKYYRNYF